MKKEASSSPGHVESLVTDARLVGERRGQILRAAVKLFSEKSYYTTTVQEIAKEAGVSTGLIYQYFGDKDDILFLSLKMVIETYEHEIPPRLEGIKHPVERLCVALWAYCMIIDGLREATVLAYRSTKSLRADRQALIKEGEVRTNRLLENCVRARIDGGFMRAVNEHMLVYQYVMFCHAWALKHWAFQGAYTPGRNVAEGIRILVETFLTKEGLAALEALRSCTADFTHERSAGTPACTISSKTKRNTP